VSTPTVEVGSGLSERVPLSFNQEFLCMFDPGDGTGPFGPRHNIVNGWRVSGAVREDVLRQALADVVARHEALRTVIVRDGETRYQRVLPPQPAQLRVLDLTGTAPARRERRVEELIIDLEAGEYPVDDLPLLRAVLGRFDERDSVLALIAHHSAVDEWSIKLLIRDLAGCYAARVSGGEPDLPPVRQYREYAQWQIDTAAGPGARAREYWRSKLDGAQILAMRTDHPRSAGLPKRTGVYRFRYDEQITSAALELARTTRSSPFMVLLAAYKVFLQRRTGVTDIVVPTLASGRGQARFQETVGLFFNFVPFRTDLSGCASFREVVQRTRRTCIEAYSREVPFGAVLAEAPMLMAPLAADDRAIVAFQVFQFPFLMEAESVGGLAYSDVRRRLISQPDSADIPDGGLFQLDIDPAGGDMIGYLGYNTNLFGDNSMREMVEQFREVLAATVLSPDAPLPLD
jgi:condensation enzyme